MAFARSKYDGDVALARAGPTVSRIALLSSTVFGCFSASDLHARQAPPRDVADRAMHLCGFIRRVGLHEFIHLCHTPQVVAEVADEVLCVNTTVNLGAGVAERHHWIVCTVARRTSRRRIFGNDMFILCFLGSVHQHVLDESSCLRPRLEHPVDLKICWLRRGARMVVCQKLDTQMRK